MKLGIKYEFIFVWSPCTKNTEGSIGLWSSKRPCISAKQTSLYLLTPLYLKESGKI